MAKKKKVLKKVPKENRKIKGRIVRRSSEINSSAFRRLAKVKLVAFSATPQQIETGQTAKLRWQVTGTSGGTEPKASIALNDEVVIATGNKSVRPFYTRSYRLTARCLSASRTLAQRTIQVDTSNAIYQNITEGDLESIFWPVIRYQIDKRNRTLPEAITITQRQLPVVQVDRTGVSLAIRMEVSLPYFPNPDVDVDVRIILGFENGKVTAHYSKFSVDVDWPWWVTVGSIGTIVGATGLAASEITALVAEDFIAGDLKPALLKDFRDGIDALIRSSGYEVIGLEMVNDELIVTKIPV
jgi:hypothetical protein